MNFFLKIGDFHCNVNWVKGTGPENTAKVNNNNHVVSRCFRIFPHGWQGGVVFNGFRKCFFALRRVARKNRFRLSGKCRLTGIFQQKHVVTLVVSVSRMCMARSCHMPLHIVGGSSRCFIFPTWHNYSFRFLKNLEQNAGHQQPQVLLAHFEHLPLLTMDIFSQNSMVLSSKILEPETCISMMPGVRRFVLALNFRTFTMPTIRAEVPYVCCFLSSKSHMGLAKYIPVLS